ncbi:MAG: ATP-binding cassette domain-containing protein [Burkholderiales bacterium]|nr:ATP-binding cassette domain-containing protein [Phycisphaerae bacterium]
MSSDVAISVRGLSKAYSISRGGVKHSTLGETLLHKLKNPFERAKRETFMALSDVNFDVNDGDVVGIVGRNGAGKSTLLKILSRITEPTTGQIDLYGRVGSLLEVGTGFHPELTGRENIFLNGQILGMRKREIDAAFDAIVDFAGVEKFLDTPVKRYSSGMYVRLAFAVAAHLNPEILIVDEVLAVGDAEFQNKCLGTMKNVAKSGRTVLFVSHNMQSVSVLCNKGLLLHNGSVAYHGEVEGAIARYLANSGTTSRQDEAPDLRPGTGEYRFTSVSAGRQYYDGGDDKEIKFTVQRRGTSVGAMYFSAHVLNELGAIVAQCDSRLVGDWFEDSANMTGSFRFTTPWLKPGHYRIDMFICVGTGLVDKYEDACALSISPVLPYRYTVPWDGLQYGTVFSDFVWEVNDKLADNRDGNSNADATNSGHPDIRHPDSRQSLAESST